MTSAPRSARCVVTAPGPSMEHSTMRTPAKGGLRAGSVVLLLRSVTSGMSFLSRGGTSFAQLLTHRQILLGGCAARTLLHDLRWPEPLLGNDEEALLGVLFDHSTLRKHCDRDRLLSPTA